MYPADCSNTHRALKVRVHFLNDMHPETAAPLHTTLLQEQYQPACRAVMPLPIEEGCRPYVVIAAALLPLERQVNVDNCAAADLCGG